MENLDLLVFRAFLENKDHLDPRDLKDIEVLSVCKDFLVQLGPLERKVPLVKMERMENLDHLDQGDLLVLTVVLVPWVIQVQWVQEECREKKENVDLQESLDLLVLLDLLENPLVLIWQHYPQ